MEVTIAETAGFCFGVSRAVNRVYELLENQAAPIVTLGSIIHNEQVVDDLARRGVKVIEEADLPALPKETIVVIRSHGVGREIYDRIEALGLKIEDVTCPFVRKIHHIVQKESRNGSFVIIIGDAAHPEVKGICGWCEGPYQVIGTAEEAEEFEIPNRNAVTIVSQTTFNFNKFQDIVEILNKKRYYNTVLDSFHILNTICNATEERQTEARRLAARVDTMLVIGGRHSSNTQKLFEICKKECINTYYIQTPVDLDSEMFQCSRYVGITAGASTPKNIIEEVLEHVRTEF